MTPCEALCQASLPLPAAPSSPGRWEVVGNVAKRRKCLLAALPVPGGVLSSRWGQKERCFGGWELEVGVSNFT